jgi:phosphoadenosine phosphosulfate reductase
MQKFEGRIALASSLGLEDQALTHMMLGIDPGTRIFTLDTGRLFPETYSLIDKTNMKYNIRIEVLFPDYAQVQQMTTRHGANLFYESIELRKTCCAVRKLEPLKRALTNTEVMVCGLRRQQSLTRENMKLAEYDPGHQLIRLNPLIDFSEEQVWTYINQNQVPYNVLHKKGFPSIGCQPCTRAVEPGQDIRAGRWWWENPEHKECGLHKY